MDALIKINGNFYHTLIVLLMLSSAILGSTIFNTLQIAVELTLFLLLTYGLSTIKLRIIDFIFISIFLIVFFVSFCINDFLKTALNFKIYGLSILTFIYFRKVYFNPKKLIKVVHAVNVFLIIHQFVTGHFIVSSAWFFGQYQEYANSRPVGIFLTPHASSFFIAVSSIHIFTSERKYFKGLLFLIVNFMIGSFTALISFFSQLMPQFFNYFSKNIPLLKYKLGWSTKLLVIGVPIFLLAIYKDQFIELLKANPYSRSNSVEIILNQLFDIRFFSDIFKFYPRDYQTFTIGQETIFADFANEIGFVKVFVEAGFILGSILLFTFIRNLRYYGIFIFVSLLHYSFTFNMPFMLFLMIQYDYEMTQKNKTDLVRKNMYLSSDRKK